MTKRRYSAAMFASIVLLGGIGAIVWKEASWTEPLCLAPDPAQNEAYASYRYGEPDTIHVGTQPLYSPTGLIAEAMRHDRILEEDLRKLGLKIEFHPFLTGYDVNHFLSRGDLQTGISGDMPTLTIAATSKVVIPVKVQDGLTWLVGKRPFLLKSLKDERIGYADGSNAHFTLLSLLSSAGLSEADVELVPMPVYDMPDALTSGAIYAFAAWEPTPTIAEMNYGLPRCFGVPSSGYMYFRKDFADKRPEAVRRIVAATARAIHWLRADKANCLRANEWNSKTALILTNKTDPLSEEENVSIARGDILRNGLAVSHGISKEELSQDSRLGKEFSFLRSIGKVPADISWKKVRDSFDETILDEVLGRSREYRIEESRYVIEPEIGRRKL